MQITTARNVLSRIHQRLIREMRTFLPASSAPRVPAEMIHDLAGIAVGRTVHVFNGSFPDQLEGESVRDDECPACQILIRLDSFK